MAKIDEYLNRRSDKAYQINVSVKQDKAQELADALEWLMQRDWRKSKSELMVDAAINWVAYQQQQPD